MKKSQFSEEQKIGILKEVRAGETVVVGVASPICTCRPLMSTKSDVHVPENQLTVVRQGQ